MYEFQIRQNSVTVIAVRMGVICGEGTDWEGAARAAGTVLHCHVSEPWPKKCMCVKVQVIPNISTLSSM